MNKAIDLTGDNSSSDDGIRVDDRPKPKRGRMSADLRLAIPPRRNGFASSSVAATAASRYSYDSSDESDDDDDDGKIIHMSYCCNIFTYF